MLNKVMLQGRLTKDPEVRYHQTSSGEPLAIAKYTLAVDRDFKRDGEPSADFISCTAMGKRGEFAEKFLSKGRMILVMGRIQVRSWDDQSGQKRWSTDVMVEEHHFVDTKASFEANRTSMSQNAEQSYQAYNNDSGYPAAQKPKEPAGFSTIDDHLDDEDLPF